MKNKEPVKEKEHPKYELEIIDRLHFGVRGMVVEVMRKSELSALENVFLSEIDGRLPFQSKAKIYQRLCDEGYLIPFQKNIGEGNFMVTVKGYQLTHAGRYAYCSSCGDEQQEQRGNRG